MAQVTITNISSEPIYVSGIQVPLSPGQQRSFVRYLPELEVMPDFMELYENGVISIDSITIESWEQNWRTFLTTVSGGYAMANQTRIIHEPIATVADALPQPGQGPIPVVIGAALGFSFTPGAPGAGDAAFRLIKIPSNYVSDPSFHVHWTKNGDTNESGNTVRWRISYTIIDGIDEDVNVAPTTIDLDDTYVDAGTTTRVVHRTANYAATGFIANYYLAVKIEALTAGTTLTVEPVVLSADLLYRANVNV